MSVELEVPTGGTPSSPAVAVIGTNLTFFLTTGGGGYFVEKGLITSVSTDESSAAIRYR
jgi:hypothetical protein